MENTTICRRQLPQEQENEPKWLTPHLVAHFPGSRFPCEERMRREKWCHADLRALDWNLCDDGNRVLVLLLKPISGKACIRSMYKQHEQFVYQNAQNRVFFVSAATDSKTLS